MTKIAISNISCNVDFREAIARGLTFLIKIRNDIPTEIRYKKSSHMPEYSTSM